MTCTSPRLAYKKTNGQFTMTPIGDTAAIAKSVAVPCGQCMSCRITHTRAWATRMVHEAYMYKGPSSFITLTYDDENLPSDGSLQPDHVQKFMKLLRKKIAPLKIRVYYVGEYGENTNRAHYHLILFGYMPEDRKPFSKGSKGDQLYTSEILSSIWKKGFVTIGEFNSTTAEYCAKYVTKAPIGKKAKENFAYTDPQTGEVIKRHPPFQRASNRPGLGTSFYEKHKDQMYALDFTVIDHVERPLPKAYDRKWQKENPLEFKLLKKKRLDKGINFANRNPHLGTKQGLKAVEIITKQKVHHKKRDTQ
jgi:hypothetical protein